jgi:hypothetical protein
MDYDKERDHGVPCDTRECEFWADEVETQNCHGETTAGDPAVICCKKYHPQNATVAGFTSGNTASTKAG